MTLHLVTGASRGLGLSLVAALLRDGGRVAAAARSPCPDSLSGLPGTLSWTRVDLSDLDAATAWARDAAADRAPGEEMVLLLNYREDGTTPFFTIWKDGVKEVKLSVARRSI